MIVLVVFCLEAEKMVCIFLTDIIFGSNGKSKNSASSFASRAHEPHITSRDASYPKSFISLMMELNISSSLWKA